MVSDDTEDNNDEEGFSTNPSFLSVFEEEEDEQEVLEVVVVVVVVVVMVVEDVRP